MRDEQRLVQRFDALAADLIPILNRLENEFYESDARDTARDLSQMGQKAAADFRQRHPEIEERAVEALAWCYTFDYK